MFKKISRNMCSKNDVQNDRECGPTSLSFVEIRQDCTGCRSTGKNYEPPDRASRWLGNVLFLEIRREPLPMRQQLKPHPMEKSNVIGNYSRLPPLHIATVCVSNARLSVSFWIIVSEAASPRTTHPLLYRRREWAPFVKFFPGF